MEQMQIGRLNAEHFRLEIFLEGSRNEAVHYVFSLIEHGLWIVNPHYKMTELMDVLNTDEEFYERFIYVETAVIDSDERTVTFSNGDGWEYIVQFDDIVGTAMAPGYAGSFRKVILVTKGEWVE